MRGSRQIVATCALGVGLLVGAIPLAAQETDAPSADGARPTLTPNNVRPDAALSSTATDSGVAFDASASTDSDGTIAAYEWDLDGDSVYETKTGSDPRVTHEYPPGTTLIASVRVVDDAGASDEATAAVVVPAAPAAPAPAPAAADAPAEPQPGSAPAAPDPAPLVPTGDLGASRQPPAVKSSRQEPTEPVAETDPTVRAAANGAVTIKDFEFAPTTVTVNAGDSVTWLNQGPTTHTATAKDGSFDSGNLAKGKSFSHKFTKAGTYSYFCKPHPFMTAKVVVAAAGSSGSGSGSSGSGSGSAGASGSSGSSSSGSSSSGNLATTGVDLLPWALFGFSLLAFGASLRYRLTD